MKKTFIILVLLLTAYFSKATTSTFAANDWGGGVGGGPNPLDAVFGQISPPDQLKNLTAQGGIGGLSSVLSSIIQIIYSVAAMVFVFMIVIGAFQWMTSGGDKEALGKAQGRLTHAVIGLVLLSLAFVFMKLIGDITGFTFSGT